MLLSKCTEFPGALKYCSAKVVCCVGSYYDSRFASRESRVTTHTSQRMYAILRTANKEEFPFCRPAITTSTKRSFWISWLPPPHSHPPKKRNFGISLCLHIPPALFSGRHGFCIRVKDVNPREKTAHCSHHRDSVSSRMLSDILHIVMKQTIRVASFTKATSVHNTIFSRMRSDTA